MRKFEILLKHITDHLSVPSICMTESMNEPKGNYGDLLKLYSECLIVKIQRLKEK